MKIAVLIKSVPDTSSVLDISPDNRSILTDGLTYVMNPYDEYALEEAVKVKESLGGEVTIISVENEKTRQIIRSGLAVGADKALLFSDPITKDFSSQGTARVLAEMLRRISPDVIFAGKVAVDFAAEQVPERIAEILNIPHVSVVTRFHLEGKNATVDREIEGGHLTLEVPIPALFTIQKGINVPRYPTLPDTLKAKSKEIKEISLSDLNLRSEDLKSGLIALSFTQTWRERQMKILEGDLENQVKSLMCLLSDTDLTF